MTVLEKLKNWLQSFPLWEDTLQIDAVSALPGSSGLFPRGITEISRKTDILGNVTTENKMQFVLYRVAPHQPEDNSSFLLALQNWIQQQSACGLAPQFGDDATRERVLAEQGKLHAVPQASTGKYGVNLTVEYIKNY